jgi:5-methyltetrahydropteroyltriglutamate--homocysteine methyltransferase
MANSEYALLDLMRARSFDKDVGLGVIDVHDHRVETLEAVVAGIERTLDLLPAGRVYVDPDCGLKTRPWPEAEAKLRVMMEAVRLVRSRRGLD